MTTILIDGHNLIGSGALPISLSDPDDEAKLIAWLRSYRQLHPKEALIVIFDAGRENGGLAGSENYEGLTVRYAPRGATADLVIIKMLEKVKQAHHITVVSSDNLVRKKAQVHGAKLLSSQEFAEWLNPKPPRQKVRVKRKPEKPERETNAEYWLNEFAKHTPPPMPAAPKRVAPTRPANAKSPPKPKPVLGKDGKPIETDTNYWLEEFSKHTPPPLPPKPATAVAPRKPQKKSAEVEDIEYWLREFTRPRKHEP